MTKTICDFCGREIPSIIIVSSSRDLKDSQFAVFSNGRSLDICQKCRDDLFLWINSRSANWRSMTHTIKEGDRK